MRWIFVWLLSGALSLAACSGSSSDVCSKLDAKFEECAPGSASRRGTLIQDCRKLFSVPEPSRKNDDLSTHRTMFSGCANASDCEEFGGCLERYGCQIIILDKDAPFSLQCQLPLASPDGTR